MSFLPAGFRIDTEEWVNIIVAILAIALSLTFVQGGLEIESSQFIFILIIYIITGGTGFLLHELAHKYMAIKFGCRARFSLWVPGIFLMIAIAIIPQLLGFEAPLFLAPGAVMIYAYKRITIKENGIISLAGPVTNIILAFVFFTMLVVLGIIGNIDNPTEVEYVLATIFSMGFSINIFLALFNLLPFYPLDGIKVLVWNWKIWILAFAISIITFILIRGGAI